MTKQLTEQAENDRAEFYANYAYRGCTCFQVAPCGYCTHPGNPLNQEEDETAWEVGPILETVQDPPQLIRVGDRVTVTKPEFVTRVGYPMSHEEAVEWVKKNKSGQLMDLLVFDRPVNVFDYLLAPEPMFGDKYEKRIISALASLYLRHKGYGGKTRSIHLECRPEELGKQYRVRDKCMVKTGTYRPSRGSGEDFEPGGLDKEKTHVLLMLDCRMCRQHDSKFSDGLWIERCNVRKVEP